MELNDLLVQIDLLQTEIRELPPWKPEVQRLVREKFHLDWNFNSNALAGNSFTIGETKSLLFEGLMPKGAKPIRHADELRAHAQAVQLVEAFAVTTEPLSDRVLSQWHRFLFRDEFDLEVLTPEGKMEVRKAVPGSFRKGPCLSRTLGGETFQHPSPADLEGRLADLLRWHQEQAQDAATHPVLHAARLHHKLLAIRPFEAGNGRLARLVMNFVLRRRGFPPVVIKKEDGRIYQAAMELADVGSSAELDQFIAQNVLEAQTLYLRAGRGESVEDADDVDRALLRLKRELANVEEPQELSQERFTRVLIGSIGPLMIRLVEKLRQFDELYSAEKLLLSSQVFSDANFQAHAPGPSISGSKSQAKQWLADFPASMIMKEMGASFSWDGFRKGGLNDFGTSLTIRVSFERRKYQIQCEPLSFARQLLYQQKLPEDEVRQFLNAAAQHILNEINQELAQPKG